MANSVQERFPEFHAPRCPKLYPKSIQNGTEDQDRRGLRTAEDTRPGAPNLRLQAHLRDLAAQDLRIVTAPPREAKDGNRGNRARHPLSVRKAQLAKCQLR